MIDPSAVAVVGSGNMGSRFARNLAAAGLAVTVIDPSEDVRERMHGFDIAAIPRIAPGAGTPRVLILSLPSVAALEDVTEQIGSAGIDRAIIIETSTLPSAAKEAARACLLEHGAGMLDAPVSGTADQAETRDLLMYVSGDEEVFGLVHPILSTICQRIRYVGEFGRGTVFKLLTNLLVAAHNLAAADVIAAACRLGVDAELLVQVLNESAGASRILELRGQDMVSTEVRMHGSPLWIYPKDLEMLEELFAIGGYRSALGPTLNDAYAGAVSAGLGQHDASAMAHWLRERR